MRKGPTIALMIGMPHAEPGQDEDNLNREQDNDSQNQDIDIAEHVVTGIVECLNDRGPGAIRLLRLLAQSFEAMADAHMARDGAGLEDAATDAHRALSKLIAD
jgi:hypothetical protein